MERIGILLVGARATADPRVDVLADAPDPAAAPDLVRRLAPRVVVVGLATEGAAAVIEELAAIGATVLAVTCGADHEAVLAALRAGASGCVVGPPDADAVLRAAAGEPVFSPGLAEVVLVAHSHPDAGPVELTERESEVLGLVVGGLTGRQIATRLVISPRTVENHTQRLLRKLGQPNRAALVRYAIEHGLA